MCWQCEIMKQPVGQFQFPVAVPAKRQTAEDRIEYLEAVIGQLIGTNQ